MRQILVGVWVLVASTIVAVAPAAATEQLTVTITTEGILTPDGSFTVSGDASPELCPGGTWVGGETRFWNWKDDGFKISQDRIFTCDSGESFVLELRNTIVFGQEDAGKATWKLKDSVGFDQAPKGAGVILVGELGEIYEGFVKFN